MGLLTPFLSGSALDPDRDLYRAAVEPDSLILPALREAVPFRVVLAEDPRARLLAGRVDVAVDGLLVSAPDTMKGRAAVAALEDAVAAHTHRLMLAEKDSAAAFPVEVEVRYVERPPPAAGFLAAPPPAEAAEGDGSGTVGGTVSGGSDGSAGSRDPRTSEATRRDRFSLLPAERTVTTPQTLSPPFPFRSLVLSYLFLIPMNFVVQFYGGAILKERVRATGEALLASPASPRAIVLGKTLPYLVLMLLIAAGTAVLLGAGWLTVVATAPIALMFLALTFAAGMFARSFRELTFLTVFSGVLLTTYAFLPAIFAGIHPVALVSPITLIVMDLRGTVPATGEILYSTLPLTLTALALFVLASGLFREEDLFHQKRPAAKALDALARRVRGTAGGLALALLLIPLVFVLELLAVSLLFAWPVAVGTVAVLVVVALIEETAKGAPSYAAASRGIITRRRLPLFGALTGLGFFLAEKGFLLAALVGLFELAPAAAVFGTLGSRGGGSLATLVLLLAGPLLLHTGTATLTAAGAARGRRAFLAALVAATLAHAAYNMAVLAVARGSSS